MEFEDVLKEVGSYGPFQKNLVFLFLAPFCVLGPFFHMALIFVVTVPDHWCRAPDLARSNWSVHEQRALIQAPNDPQCRMKKLNYSDLILKGYIDVPNDTETVSCQYGWEYDTSEFDATAATKWDLVCSDSHYISLILTLQNIGGLIATPIYGFAADRLGRKTAFFIAVGVTSMSELFSILTPSFALFAFLKCVSGAAMPTIMMLPYILVSEIVGPEKRVLISGIINTCWTLGMCFLSLVMYWSRSWITMGVVNTIASLLTLLYWKYVPESPAWLLSVGKYDEAYNTLMRIGIKNEKIPDEISLVKKLQYLGEKINAKKEEEKQKSIYQFIIKYPNLRKIFLIITFCWAP